MVKDNKKKCFYKHINRKRRAKENLHPLLDVVGNMTTGDKEEAEILNAFFTSAFNSQTSYPQGTQLPDLEIWDREQKKPPTIQVERVRDLLLHLDRHKFTGSDGIHPRVLRELADVNVKLLSIISQWSWSTREVPVEWRLSNMTPIYEKDRKEDPGNYRPVSLTSVLENVREHIITRAITQDVQDYQGIRPSQHGFMKGKTCPTNLISFYDQ